MAMVLRSRLFAGVLVLGALTALAPAAAPKLAVSRTITPGKWELTDSRGRLPAQTLCIADPDTLIQFRHAGLTCAWTIEEDRAALGTVRYSCPDAGNGRTTLSAVTPRLIHLDTQGIADGQPFHVTLDGRRLGACE